MTPGFAPFLAAVVAAPDDDLPRLIAADWLDERGEPERAEFIRLQVKLAGYDAKTFADCPGCEAPGEGWAHADDCPRSPKHPLRRREREVLDAYGFSQYPGSKWVDAECPELWKLSDRGATFAFRRGFVSEITLAAADWLAHADAILAACPIRNAKDGVVRLTTWPELDEWTEGARPMQRLRGGRYEDDAQMPRSHATMSLLGHEWPGVRFELPPPLSASWATTTRTTPLADFHRVMGELGSDVVVSPRVMDADFS